MEAVVSFFHVSSVANLMFVLLFGIGHKIRFETTILS